MDWFVHENSSIAPTGAPDIGEAHSGGSRVRSPPGYAPPAPSGPESNTRLQELSDSLGYPSTVLWVNRLPATAYWLLATVFTTNSRTLSASFGTSVLRVGRSIRRSMAG